MLSCQSFGGGATDTISLHQQNTLEKMWAERRAALHQNRLAAVHDLQPNIVCHIYNLDSPFALITDWLTILSDPPNQSVGIDIMWFAGWMSVMPYTLQT